MLWETKLAFQGQVSLYVFRVEVVEMGLRVGEMMSISTAAPTTRTVLLRRLAPTRNHKPPPPPLPRSRLRRLRLRRLLLPIVTIIVSCTTSLIMIGTRI